MNEARCGKCRWWHLPAANGRGLCRIRSVDSFPVRASWEACGEFVPAGPTPLDMLRTELRLIVADMGATELRPAEAGIVRGYLDRIKKAIGDA